MGGHGLRELDVTGGEKARLGLVDRVQPDDAVGGQQRHPHPVADVLGPGIALPARMASRLADQDAAPPANEGVEDRMIAHVEGASAGEDAVIPALGTVDGPHGQLPVLLQQHDVGRVVGDEPCEVLEELVEENVEVQGAREVEGGRPQDLRSRVHSG